METLVNPTQTPVSYPRKNLITAEIAREWQARSIAAQRQKKITEELRKNLPPQLSALSPQVATVEKQLAKVSLMIDDCNDADSLNKLTAARTRLFNEWQVLTGTPNPGARKSKPTRSVAQDVQPIEPVKTV